MCTLGLASGCVLCAELNPAELSNVEKTRLQLEYAPFPWQSVILAVKIDNNTKYRVGIQIGPSKSEEWIGGAVDANSKGKMFYNKKGKRAIPDIDQVKAINLVDTNGKAKFVNKDGGTIKWSGDKGSVVFDLMTDDSPNAKSLGTIKVELEKKKYPVLIVDIGDLVPGRAN